MKHSNVNVRSERDVEWPDRVEISDPAAVALLTDFRALGALEPFLRGTHTLTSAAKACDRAPSSLAYWVPRFVDCGLLEVVEVVPRAGSSMKRYRAPARRLVVPYAEVPFDARVRFMDEGRMMVLRRFLDGLDVAMASSNTFGLSFGVHRSAGSPDGGVGVESEELPTAGRERRRPLPGTDYWTTLRLDHEDAEALVDEIDALIGRYVGRNGAKEYVLHAGVVPDPERPWRSVGDRRAGHR